MRTSSVLPKREASRKHWLTLSAPPSTNIPSKPCIAAADVPDAQPGSNELEKRVRGKQAASNASVKSFPVRWLPARSKKVLKADNWSWISTIVLWFPPPLLPWQREWIPMHFKAHSVNFWTLAPASAFKISSPLHSWRRSCNLSKYKHVHHNKESVVKQWNPSTTIQPWEFGIQHNDFKWIKLSDKKNNTKTNFTSSNAWFPTSYWSNHSQR